MTPAEVFARYELKRLAFPSGFVLRFVSPIQCHCVRKEARK